MASSTHPNTVKTHCPQGHAYTHSNTYYNHPETKTGRACKECRRTRTLAFYHTTKATSATYGVERYREKKYGLSSADFNQMVSEQQGRCAICGADLIFRRNQGGRSGASAIDHDHKTGRVRGLLCGACNRGIGLLQEDEFVLESAIWYLKGGGQ